MTDKELIQALRKVHDAYFTPGVHSHSIYGHAADRLEALMAENERLKEQMPKWRPASEPPEKDGRYLCVKRIGKSGAHYVTIMNGDEHGFSMEHIYSDDVTHWMPLPEPPSTEGVE